MARRRKTSPFEDLTSVLALLPWWVCLGLGVAGYFVLHALAAPAAPGSSFKPDKLPALMVTSLFKGLAMAGQFIVPIICLAAAVMSAVARRQRGALVSTVAASRAPDALHEMSWREFEMLVGESFRLQGYKVMETGQALGSAAGGVPDGGVDLVLSRDREKYLVQCKQWKAFKVGVPVVRELYGVMAAQGAAGGFVVTSGSFTAEAVAFAEGRNVRLLDGKELFRMIQQARAGLASGKSKPSPPAPAGSRPAPPAPSVSKKPTTPFGAAVATASTGMVDTLPRSACPICTGPMVRRNAKKGANAGKAFLGCVSYPVCRGTRQV